MHSSVILEEPVRIYGTVLLKKGVQIGKYSFVNNNSCVFMETQIGRYTSIGKNCEIGAYDHPIERASTSPAFYNLALHFPEHADKIEQHPIIHPPGVVIGHDVWIGSHVLIRRGITIGNGAVIAAGAVVTKNVPPYAIVGGLPAKLIRYRFSADIIKKMQKLKWWNLEEERLSGINFTNPQIMIQQLTKKTVTKKTATKKTATKKTATKKTTVKNTNVFSVIKQKLVETGVQKTIVQHLTKNKHKLFLNYDLSDTFDQQILNNKVEFIYHLKDSMDNLENMKEKALTVFVTKE